MQLQRIWTDAQAEIRFWQLMRSIEEARDAQGGFWSRLTLAPQRAARRSEAMRREAEALVERFTLVPGATPEVPRAVPDDVERLTRIHSAIRVAATLANDAPHVAARGRVRPGQGA
ncbi:hypothetical protein [Aureimonas jatrophae]|jgi:hypothetical protein|uniref:Uncharacterized protein n=1 Tax=Aureimonas jatrophae TaxID=1166073 RepID=A0A1H0DA71_9HYPH|nr:hypothetical protein [Aureimonas jatrophae]MBB3951775.1 hypothetical protein [Aureimonas jatrophae]SDN66871.1 hypothetical protein SAMN05192530_101667 [Aureimonas jatrophae]